MKKLHISSNKTPETPSSRQELNHFLKWILLICFCSFPFGIAAQEPPRQAIIIDTDMAIDDWLAILYLLRHPNVEVKAITLAGTGEAHCNPGLQNL